MEVPRSSVLYTQPPEASEVTKLPLQALTEGFQVVLTDLGICWVFVGVGQSYGDEPSLEGLECGSIDARQTPEEVPAAFPGETPYPVSDASTTTPTGTEPVTGLGIPEGKCRYRPSYGRGNVGNPLM